ncbi:MAG: hypothetical protein GYB64_05275 [Chloroflexi bacterium]|nr:hypothetical protein [Chloroflexota bacterium]
MADFMHIPFWRTGGYEDITYRTQIYITPLSQETVRLGIYLFENGGKPWSGRSFVYEIDQHADEVETDRNGLLIIDVGPGQTVRIEINAPEHEYGTGELHLLSGDVPIPVLARGDLEIFAAEASGFEMSVSAIEITGARPIVVDPRR